ncbi:MAG: lipopolysaccharide biosynthesis protein [Prolixibacteraceae bacterium]|nr:lipopolysaccharide biosynthesis protein [Prolixibacteraceae bacterium]
MNYTNLKEKTVNGFKWSSLDKFGKLGGQFVVGIILTRLLDPVDYGLIGMITIFIVIGQSLINSGFGQALIQKKDADNVDFSTVFYFNIFASVLIYLILFFSAPLIARFYDQPQLIPLIKVICLSFVIDAFGLVHITWLAKNLHFKAPSLIGIISVIISGTISILMAYKGFGVWALVSHVVLRSAITSFSLWWVSKWKPLLVFSKTSLKKLFSFGSKILIAGLMQSIFHNIYFLIIGRFFIAESLGYYTRAVQFRDLPVKTITAVVQNVTFPVFSALQDDDGKLFSGYTKVIRMLSAAVLPLMVLIFMTSRPLIHMVLGEKWLPVIPYLKLMALYGWVYVIFTINTQIVVVRGRSDYYLQIQIIDKVLIVIALLLTYKYNIMAIIYGNMVATVMTALVTGIYLRKVINISLLYQLKSILPFIFAAFIMLICGIILEKYIKNDLWYLLSSVSLSTMIYIFILWIIKVDELKTGIKMASNLFRSS